MKNKLLALASAAVMTAGVVSFATADAEPRSMRAKLVTGGGDEIGTVDFLNDRGYTEVKVNLSGAPGNETFHGFHIHSNAGGSGCEADENASPSTWFVSAGGHYNPGGATHSQHAGDMPVVFVNRNGSVETRFRIDRINASDLAGKVVILHAKPDNYANIPLSAAAGDYTANSAAATTATGNTGNAGNRLACGIIEAR